MARKMTEWPSKRGPITKIMPSDGCIGDTVCVFRGIRPVIPTTSGHLNRGIRPPLFSGFEA